MTAAYGLELQSRALCPLYHQSNTSQDCHRFLVGTCSYSAENKIHLLEFHDETKTLECTSVWQYPEQVYGLWCSPSISDRSLVAVTSPNSLSVLQISNNLMSGPTQVWTTKLQAQQVVWDLEGLQNEVKFVQGNKLVKVSLEGKIGSELSSYTVDAEAISSVSLDPHHSSMCLATCGTGGIHAIDFRTKKTMKIANSECLHGFNNVTGVDFNPSKPNEILTYGVDGYVRFHDLRISAKEATLSTGSQNHLKAHDHAISRSLYNPFHQDLIISGGSDQSVKLWDAGSSKSRTIRRLTDFGDTVMDVCWSSNGPWVFAGVSYNGKVLVDTVPSEKKMSILLEEKK